MKNYKKNLKYLFSFLIFFTFSSCTDLKKGIIVNSLKKNKRNHSQIILYIYPQCPYCKRVMNYLKSSGNEDKVLIMDASDRNNLQKLRQLNNNNTQCPFLYDPEKNVKMLESLDIIAYLKKRFE